MPKLYSSRSIEKILLANGFYFTSQNGSHKKFRKTRNPVLTVILPGNKREIPYGTFRSILKQSRLTEEDFEK